MWRRCRDHGRGLMVVGLMMAVVVVKVVREVVRNLFFEGFRCWYISYYFCTNSLRRVLRRRCFVVLVA